MGFFDSIKSIFHKDLCDEFPNIEESMEIVNYYGSVMCSSYKYLEDLDYEKYKIRRALVHYLIEISSENGFWDKYDRDSEVKYKLSTMHKSPCSKYYSVVDGLYHLSCMRSKEGRGFMGESDRCQKFLKEFQRKSRVADVQIKDDYEIEITELNEIRHERIMMDFVKPFLKSEYSHDNE